MDYSLTDLNLTVPSLLPPPPTPPTTTTIDSLFISATIMTITDAADTDYSSSVEDNWLRNVLIVIVYGIIIVVSLSGNCLVCFVVYSNRKLRTTTNIMIVSLTVSDILTTTLNIPFNCARILLDDWPFPDSLCIGMPVMQVCCVYVSTVTMTVISVHRYYSVVRHSRDMSRYMSTSRLNAILAGTWLLSLVLSVPHAMFNRVVEVQYIGNRPSMRCRTVYPNVDIHFDLVLTIEAIVTQFLIPLSVTCCLYMKIAAIIARQGQLAAHSTDETYRRYCDAKRKRIVMLVLVCLTFAVCWLPLNAYHLLMDLNILPHNYTIFLILHALAMSSVCYNPMIYCFMNQAFRRGVRNVCCVKLILIGGRRQKSVTVADDPATDDDDDDDDDDEAVNGIQTITANGEDSHHHQHHNQQPVMLTSGVLEQTYV
ncbi:G-protein coupled receptor 83-like [Oppia nitens]|uniref:G-protein coupled receptor 83-like n=1 Tax=Oppia nitens TaxID=1686743 RepID=UPI0023DB09C0|nr:G-protein coupled receptor 83-like [Oppia nitens]